MAAKAPELSHADVLHAGFSAEELEHGPVAARYVASILEFQKVIVEFNTRLKLLEEKMSGMSETDATSDKTWKVNNQNICN